MTCEISRKQSANVGHSSRRRKLLIVHWSEGEQVTKPIRNDREDRARRWEKTCLEGKQDVHYDTIYISEIFEVRKECRKE